MATRIGYAIYPTWRSYAHGRDRTQSSLERRVNVLRNRKRLHVVLVGGVYLDVYLKPVYVDMTPNEYADLGAVRTSPGGSAYFVGRHLGERGRRSYLFSRMGKGDLFSRQLKRHLEDADWIRGENVSTARSGQCAVSVHLLEPSGIPLPTYTHRGALQELTWSRCLQDVQRYLRGGGGVLYVSGFFRTSLDNDLRSSINALPPDTLAVIDHGRFKGEYYQAALRTLLEAFATDVFDIYVCTMTEIMELASGAGVRLTPGLADGQAVVREILDGIRLPRVTIVRGDAKPRRQARAIVAFDGSIFTIKEGPLEWTPTGEPGGKSAFTAGLIEYLFVGNDRNVDEAIREAVRAGLRAWVRKG